MAMAAGGGESFLKEGAEEEKGEYARLASFVGAMAIADLVKSTLGPKGAALSRRQRNDIIVASAAAATLARPAFVLASGKRV
mgnify:CR=1 FL=1